MPILCQKMRDPNQTGTSRPGISPLPHLRLIPKTCSVQQEPQSHTDSWQKRASGLQAASGPPHSSSCSSCGESKQSRPREVPRCSLAMLLKLFKYKHKVGLPRKNNGGVTAQIRKLSSSNCVQSTRSYQVSVNTKSKNKPEVNWFQAPRS